MFVAPFDISFSTFYEFVFTPQLFRKVLFGPTLNLRGTLKQANLNDGNTLVQSLVSPLLLIYLAMTNCLSAVFCH